MEGDLGSRDGGKGHESASENSCETRVRRERTRSRVRRESTGATIGEKATDPAGTVLEEGKICASFRSWSTGGRVDVEVSGTN